MHDLAGVISSDTTTGEEGVEDDLVPTCFNIFLVLLFIILNVIYIPFISKGIQITSHSLNCTKQ